MKNNIKERANEIANLVDDARELLEATANLTGQKVQKARKRLTLALEHEKSVSEELIDASTDMAVGHIEKLRDHITPVLDRGKEIYTDVHDDLVRRTQAVDHAVRENPYPVMGISLSAGALVGFVISSRLSHHGR